MASQPERDWREAKMPQWVKDSIAADMKAGELRAALSWPTEARPTPVFWGVGYGRTGGKPESGTFYTAHGDNAPEPREIEVNDLGSVSEITLRGTREIISYQRFYRTAREARLAALWTACDEAAEKLLKISRRVSL